MYFEEYKVKTTYNFLFTTLKLTRLQLKNKIKEFKKLLHFIKVLQYRVKIRLLMHYFPIHHGKKTNNEKKNSNKLSKLTNRSLQKKHKPMSVLVFLIVLISFLSYFKSVEKLLNN